ncbi:MAG TPA: ABC transporter permease [Stellaceae bacterium]|nr:ABC transporter permease [Stellaceae bacterium]
MSQMPSVHISDGHAAVGDRPGAEAQPLGERCLTPPALAVTSILAGLLVWELVARAFFQPFTLPAPSAVAAKAFELLRTGNLLGHIAASYTRIFTGFVIGSAVGGLLGIAMGTVSHIRRLLEPLVNFFRFIPPIAWIGPVLIWFGIGEASKVLLIVYTTSFMVLLNALAGISSIPRNQLRAAECFGASTFQVFCLIMLPAAVRYLLTGMRIGLMNSFATIITAEMIAAQSGLGYLILVSFNYSAVDTIFVSIATLGVLGLVTSQLFDKISRLIAWRYYLDA